jgi:hypothetical protein
VTGPEHYVEADKLVAEVRNARPDANPADVTILLAIAQVHAVLAQAAALAEGCKLTDTDTYPGSAYAWAKAVS